MHMLRLRLLVDYRTEPIVEKRFRILAHISNQLRKHVKKQLSRLEKDKVYQIGRASCRERVCLYV